MGVGEKTAAPNRRGVKKAAALAITRLLHPFFMGAGKKRAAPSRRGVKNGTAV